MTFLCLAAAVLLHPCCYQKEGVGTFLVCSCKSIGDELHTYTHASGSRRILSLTLQVPCDPTLDQSTWQRREQRRPQLRPQPQRRRLLSRQTWICSSQILLACFFKFCICSSQHFFLHHTLNAALWTESHLRLFPTETGVRYFVKSFVLCAEGHRHPQQGWVAARADYWPLKANWADARKK